MKRKYTYQFYDNDGVERTYDDFKRVTRLTHKKIKEGMKNAHYIANLVNDSRLKDFVKINFGGSYGNGGFTFTRKGSDIGTIIAHVIK